MLYATVMAVVFCPFQQITCSKDHIKMSHFLATGPLKSLAVITHLHGKILSYLFFLLAAGHLPIVTGDASPDGIAYQNRQITRLHIVYYVILDINTLCYILLKNNNLCYILWGFVLFAMML